jgi:hypothetical protein
MRRSIPVAGEALELVVARPAEREVALYGLMRLAVA